MARAKKDYKALNIKIESSIYERLENYAEEKGRVFDSYVTSIRI